MRSHHYDMRSPVDPAYEDWLEVKVCRTWWGRIEGAIWLLFSNWGPPE